jgi:hypothetical protein
MRCHQHFLISAFGNMTRPIGTVGLAIIITLNRAITDDWRLAGRLLMCAGCNLLVIFFKLPGGIFVMGGTINGTTQRVSRSDRQTAGIDDKFHPHPIPIYHRNPSILPLVVSIPSPSILPLIATAQLSSRFDTASRPSHIRHGLRSTGFR